MWPLLSPGFYLRFRDLLYFSFSIFGGGKLVLSPSLINTLTVRLALIYYLFDFGKCTGEVA